MTSISLTKRQSIINRIQQFNSKSNLSIKHKALADTISQKCNDMGYLTKRMGSVTKKTELIYSDIDILAIIPDNKTNFDSKTTLNHLKQKLNSFNPQIGNHSVIIRKDGVGIDVVPAKKTKEKDQYMIPDRKSNEWINRGQDIFTKEFNCLNQKVNGKLSTSTKILKMWNLQKTSFNLSNLSIEKICSDALKSVKKSLDVIDIIIICFKELRTQVTQNIRHPSKGPQLNKLTLREREIWEKVIDRDLRKLSKIEPEVWIKVLGI